MIGRLRSGSSFVLQAVLYDGSGQVRGRFDIPLGQAALDAAAEERVRQEGRPGGRAARPSASDSHRQYASASSYRTSTIGWLPRPAGGWPSSHT